MTTVSTKDFLDFTRTGPDRWMLPIRPKILGGRIGSLFGGAGLAAGVLALEEATDRAIIWATCQFLATVSPPSSLDLRADLPAVGGSVTQGRIRGFVDEREIISVAGAAGARRQILSGQWHEHPTPPPPLECEPLARDIGAESIHRHIEARLGRGMFGFGGIGTPTADGTNLLWMRLPGVRLDPAALAVMADYLGSAVGNAFGRGVHCSSIDNTIRFATPIASDTDADWVLCQNRIDFVGNGFANGTSLMWSESGHLLATASQSMIVSLPPRFTPPGPKHTTPGSLG